MSTPPSSELPAPEYVADDRAAHALTPSQLDACRPQLLRVCYRMLGSMADAEDAVQDAMLRAWKARESFAGRSSRETWLTSIAVRVCLDQFARRKRTLPPLLGPAGALTDDLDMRANESWIEPMADAWAAGTTTPESEVLQRESLSLAWVTALQELTPTQRASLVLMDVAGLSAVDAADSLETTVASVNSSLQRARRALEAVHARERAADPTTAENDEAVRRFAEAFGRYDLDALAAMLREDATMCMPPLALWLRGAEKIAAWMGGRGAACRGSRLVATQANGRAAWGQYKPVPDGAGFDPWSLVVPIAHDGVVDELHFFLNTEELFPRFGLPMHLPAVAGDDA